MNGTIQVSTTAQSGSPAGEYVINVVGGNVQLDNYVIQLRTGKLTVAPAPLTISVADVQKRYCAPMPALTANYSGFVRGETSADLDSLPTVTAPVDASTPVGTYAIQITGAADNNYSINYQPGQVNVIAQPTSLLLSSTTLETTTAQTIELTANVLPQDACQPIEPGQVNFYDNGVLLGVAEIEAGKAVLSNVTLTPGKRSIVAEYVDPDRQYESSQSTAVLVQAWDAVDTSHDTFVTALDALLVINWLNQATQQSVPYESALDVNDDGFITALDALLVINRLNQA